MKIGTDFIIRLVVHWKVLLHRVLCTNSAAMPSYSLASSTWMAFFELVLGLGENGTRIGRGAGRRTLMDLSHSKYSAT